MMKSQLHTFVCQTPSHYRFQQCLSHVETTLSSVFKLDPMFQADWLHVMRYLQSFGLWGWIGRQEKLSSRSGLGCALLLSICQLGKDINRGFTVDSSITPSCFQPLPFCISDLFFFTQLVRDAGHIRRVMDGLFLLLEDRSCRHAHWEQSQMYVRGVCVFICRQ